MKQRAKSGRPCPAERETVSAAGDPVVAVTFDPSGEVVASATAGGLVAVQAAATLRVSEAGPARYRPPRHRIPFGSRNEG